LLTPKPATDFNRRSAMTLDYILSSAVTVFLTVYLTYALIRPERF